MYETRSFSNEKNGACGNGRSSSCGEGRPHGRGSRVLACLLILCLALTGLLTGCAVSARDKEETVKKESIIPPSVGKRVSAPVKADYFISNNLQTETISVTAEKNRTGEYFVISGLADSEVQDKINDKLYKTFMKYLQNDNPPPYRGAKLETADYDGPESVYVGMNLMGNVNNILSVTLSRVMCFGEDSALCYSDLIPLNIDLNTGSSIALSEMFADNIDYLEYVNDAVSEAVAASDFDGEDYGYYGENPDLRLTAPFTGMDENQKFYLSGRDGSIVLLLDYNTPEFYTEGTYETLVLPYSDKMAFTKRFMGSDSIFEDKTVNKLLRAGDGYELSDRVIETEDISRGNIEGELRKVYYGEQPGYIAKEIERLAASKEEFFAAFEEKYAEYAGLYGEDNISAYVSIYIYSDKIAGREYIQLEEYGGIYTVSSDLDDSLTMTGSRYITYEKDSDEIVGIDEIFKNPEKKTELLEKAISANRLEYYDEDALWPADADDFVEEAIAHINGFCLTSDALQLSYDCDVQELAVEYFGIDYKDADKFGFILRNCGLEYSDIGCGSLTIF